MVLKKGYTGVVGKLTDITDDYMVMENVREEGLKVLEKIPQRRIFQFL